MRRWQLLAFTCAAAACAKGDEHRTDTADAPPAVDAAHDAAHADAAHADATHADACVPHPEFCGDGIDQDCDGSDAPCAPNDRPDDAIDISAGGTFTADLSAAHDDDTGACGSAGGRDVFYQLVLPAAEVVYLDTFGSTFDSVIHMSSGLCTATSVEQACAASACGLAAGQIAMQFAAGTYCVVVDQAAPNDTATGNGPGSAVLHVIRGGRTGTAIANDNGSTSGNTIGHTDQTTPEAACEVNSGQPDDGYYFTSCPGHTLTVGATTCGSTPDTIIYLRSGSAKSASLACDDDGCNQNDKKFQSVFSGAQVVGAGLSWLIVDGFGTGSSGKGPYTLTWTIQ